MVIVEVRVEVTAAGRYEWMLVLVGVVAPSEAGILGGPGHDGHCGSEYRVDGALAKLARGVVAARPSLRTDGGGPRISWRRARVDRCRAAQASQLDSFCGIQRHSLPLRTHGPHFRVCGRREARGDPYCLPSYRVLADSSIDSW